jgi:hypothetical protein
MRLNAPDETSAAARDEPRTVLDFARGDFLTFDAIQKIRLEPGQAFA